MHELRTVFAIAEGEVAWTQQMNALFADGEFDEAETMLAEALSALDTELAWTCLELPREAVVLSGWEELGEAIALHEGPPVTGVTIAIANDADRDFAKGAVHSPHVRLGLYTDEAFGFSGATPRRLLAECRSHEPGWSGREEDVEVHMDIEGLDTLNTLLLHHKQRHFFRDATGEPAPLRYVEFVLGCWWRALRWHQAVATECSVRGLPRGIPAIAGMVEMRPEVVAVHSTGRGAMRPALTLVTCDGTPVIADSFGDSFIQRRAPTAEDIAPPSVQALRRRAQGEGERARADIGRPQRRGFLARIFSRPRELV